MRKFIIGGVCLALVIAGIWYFGFGGSKTGSTETTEQTDTTTVVPPGPGPTIGTQPLSFTGLLAPGSLAVPVGKGDLSMADEGKISQVTKLDVKARALMLVRPTKQGKLLVQVDQKGKVVNYIVPRGKLTIS